MNVDVAVSADPGDAAFRPIQYLGNKWRLLDAIEEATQEVAVTDGPAGDLFAGSGVVSHRLARHRSICASDIQEYSRVLTTAMLDPRPLPAELAAQLVHDALAHEQALTTASGYASLVRYENEACALMLADEPEHLCRVLEVGSIQRHESERDAPTPFSRLVAMAAASMPSDHVSTLSRYYGGLYFSYLQAAQLDALGTAVRDLPSRYQPTALAAVLGTASELVSSVGNQFAQPIRPRDKSGRIKLGVLRTVARKRAVSVTDTFAQRLRQHEALPRSTHLHSVRREDYRETLRRLPSNVAVVYADPPYTRDHYSRFYHVLETIALGDAPAVTTSKMGGNEKLSRAMYRAQRHQSPFCIRSQVVPAFEHLFREVSHRQVPLVLSYSPYSSGTAARPQPRLVTIDALVALARRYFRRVDVEPVVSVHSKLNQDRLNRAIDHHAEVLLIARP